MTDVDASLYLVPTKLNRPSLDSRWISRPRLLSALDDGLSRKLTLLSAPAGYGKTTLVVQWLDQISQPSAWLSLDKHDSDEDRFLRYLIASIRKSFPLFGSQIEPLLSTPTLPPPDHLTDILISDLTALNKALVLALDDFHTIVSEPVQMMIARLIQYLPDQFHLVIASRVDPPLPLVKWRLLRWLSEFRAADLRFFSEEAQAFFAPIKTKKLSSEALERILARAEGWVAGLQLARLSMAQADDPDALAKRFSGSDRMVVEYLMDEIVSRQPDEIKYFLAVAAILERFCAPLCDHLLGEDGGIRESRRLIDWLEKSNLFLVPLDNQRLWYRFHHLFQNLLLHHLQPNLSPERRAKLHQRAGKWFAGQGLVEEALHHLLAAGDVDHAAELLASNMHHLIQSDLSRRTLMRLLEMFPIDAQEEHPVLLVAHACCKIYTWDLAGILSLINGAENLLRDPDSPIAESVRRILQANIDAMYGFCFYWQGDPKRSLFHARRAIHSIPKDHQWLHSFAIMYTAASLAATSHYEEAMQFLSEKVTDDYSAGSLNVGPIFTAKAAILCYAGNLDGVEEVAHRVLEDHKIIPVPDYWLSHAYYFLGTVAYERNLLDLAENYFGRVEQMIYRVNMRIFCDSIISRFWVRGPDGPPEKSRGRPKQAGPFLFLAKFNLTFPAILPLLIFYV